MNFNRVQKRRGIGNVITTLIILIASVVLGAGVIFFGGSMFQTNTQSESIKVSNVHSWVFTDFDYEDPDNPVLVEHATTAFVVQNTGSKAVTINSITLRGLQVPNDNWYSSKEATAIQLQSPLPVSYNMGADILDDFGTFTPGSISLNQGEAAVVYMLGAGNMKPIDAGNTYSLQIQAGQATAVQQVQVITAAGPTTSVQP